MVVASGKSHLDSDPDQNASAEQSSANVSPPPAVQDPFLGKLDKFALPIILVLALFCFFFRLGSVGICDGSESYYPSAAREMVEAGNYLVPQLNYQILFAKPIMIFWLIIAGYKMFGMTAFAARFFAAVVAVGLTGLTYASARTVSNPRTGLLAALIVMASPLVLDYARLSEIDLFFSSFLALSFLSTLLVVCAGRKKLWPLIYVGLGCALLTKGPASLVIYAVGCFMALALQWKDHRRKFLPALVSIHPILGVILMLAIALPWWVEVWRATDHSFPTYFLAYENFGRAAGHTNSNPMYWFKYPVVILLGLFPWSLFLPALLWRTLRSISGKGPKLPDATGAVLLADGELSPSTTAPKESKLLDAKRWALGCGAAVITIFGLSRTQMEPYLLPMMAPLAVYIALSVNDWLVTLAAGKSSPTSTEGNSDSAFASKWTGAVSTSIFVLGLIVAAGGFSLPSVFKLPLQPVSWPLIALPLSGVLIGAAMVAQFILLRRGLFQKGFLAMALIYTLGTTIGVEAGIEAWYGNTMRDLHYLCTLLENKPGQVGFYADCRSSVLFYVKRPVYFFFQSERLVPYASYKFKLSDQALKFPLFVFTERKHLPALTSQKDVTFTTVGERGKWGLYEVKGARLEPYETLINTFSTVPLTDLATKQLPTGPLTLPFGGGTFKHNMLDPYQYR